MDTFCTSKRRYKYSSRIIVTGKVQLLRMAMIQCLCTCETQKRNKKKKKTCIFDMTSYEWKNVSFKKVT